MSVLEEIYGCLGILPVDKKRIKSSAHIYDTDQALIADYPRYHSHSFSQLRYHSYAFTTVLSAGVDASLDASVSISIINRLLIE